MVKKMNEVTGSSIVSRAGTVNKVSGRLNRTVILAQIHVHNVQPGAWKFGDANLYQYLPCDKNVCT